MSLTRFTGGLLLAPIAAILLTAAPDRAVADPPFAGRGVGAGGCPPGLAKKNPECMPPGQYKKLHRGDRFGDFRRDDDFRDFRRGGYRRGDRIPDFRQFEPFPYREYGLPAPGPNRRYIRRGDEAYLISEGTQRILEAIRLFEEAGD